MKHQKFFAAGAGILPHATAQYSDLEQRQLLHRYVNHVRSSQAFAINLLGELDDDEALRLWQRLEPNVTDHVDTTFEYEDPHDELAEAQPARPHKTQVDVLLRGTDRNGQPHVALIEVKLTETGFGACTAFESPYNHRRDVCTTPGPWGGDPASCFQLANHDGPHRRRYDHFIAATDVPVDGAPHCSFLEANQVARNVALARALVERHEAASATVALCAPTGNRAVWRQWRRCQQLLAGQDRVRLVDLPAHEVAATRNQAVRQAVEARYGLTEELS